MPVEVFEPVKFKQMLQMLNDYDLVLFANETNRQITDINFEGKHNIALIIGSEGGFSQTEINSLTSDKITQIGLGERILRCETASIFLCGLVSYLTKN